MGLCNKSTKEQPVTSQPSRTQTPPSSQKSGPTNIPPVTIIPIEPPKFDPPKLRVSLQSVGQKQTDTVNTPLPPVFYVIIGRGPAATIDHTTILQSTTRLGLVDFSPAGKLPILHIGYSNPWSKFFSHGMGQPTYLLSLPGFHDGNKPEVAGKTSVKDGGLTSTVFGACVDRELAWCLEEEAKRWEFYSSRTPAFKSCGWPVLEGWVGWVQSRSDPGSKPSSNLISAEPTGATVLKAINEKCDEPYPLFPEGVAPYRLIVLVEKDGDFTPQIIYAQYIDICSGSGRPRQDKKDYATARLEPWRNPETWNPTLKSRKIVVATEAVRTEFTWPKGKRICVANGGAIALNAAERARDEECWTDWFHVPDLLESFGNPRNLTFIRHRLEDRCREPGEGGPLSEPDLIAADRRIRLGRSADAETVVETATGVDVSLKKGVPRNPKVVALDPLIRDYKGNGLALDTTAKHWPVSEWYAGEFASLHGECPWPCKTYDQIVFHTGLVTNEVGQPAKIVPENLDPLKGPKNRMIGMASADGRIRVLGAAAQMYPGLPQFDAANPGSTPSDLMWVFRQQLPVSAVPDGFILTGINIAVANDFFTPFNENKNINTMTQDEIASALRSAGIFFDADDLAKAIVEARNSSNGFSDLADLRKKLKAAAKRKPELIDAEKKRAEEEAWKNYNEEQKRTAELKSVYKDSVPTEITELEKLQRENQVNRLASISLSADRQKQEVDGKAKQLDDLLSTESGKINSAFKYSY